MGGSGRTKAVPVFTVIRSTKEEPNSVPAASPRLPRSTSPWPPRTTPTCLPESSPSRRNGTSAHRARPISARFEPVYLSRDVLTLVPRVLLFITLAEPTPSGSTGMSRLCRGCSHLPRHLPGRAALSGTDLLLQNGDGLPPPFELSAPHCARGSGLNRSGFSKAARPRTSAARTVRHRGRIHQFWRRDSSILRMPRRPVLAKMSTRRSSPWGREV